MGNWTKRPQNRCKQCGYTWYPRGKSVSLRCPNCGSQDVGINLIPLIGSLVGLLLCCLPLSCMGLFGSAFRGATDHPSRPTSGALAEAKDKTKSQQKDAGISRPSPSRGRTDDSPIGKEPAPKSDTASGVVPKTDTSPPKAADPKPSSPKQSPEERRREIYAEFAEADRAAEQEALEMHPKPKGPGVTLVDQIKAENARQAYVVKRLKEVKEELVERYRISLSELDSLIREGKRQGWPKTRAKP